MTNRLQEAIDCNDGDQAAKTIRDALGIESDEVANYCLPKNVAYGSRAPASLATGCRPRRVFWADARKRKWTVLLFAGSGGSAHLGGVVSWPHTWQFISTA